MKTIYKVFISLLSMCAFCTMSISALDWHERMVNLLLESDAVKKSVSVQRQEYSPHRITKASYVFAIDKSAEGESVAQDVKQILLNQSLGATAFSLSDNGTTMILQVYEAPSLWYNYKLSKEKNQNVLKIIVSDKESSLAVLERQ